MNISFRWRRIPNSSAAVYLRVVLQEIGLNTVGSTCFHSLILFISWLTAWGNI